MKECAAVNAADVSECNAIVTTKNCNLNGKCKAVAGEFLQCAAKPCDGLMPRGQAYEDSCLGFVTDSAECTQVCADGYYDNNNGQ